MPFFCSELGSRQELGKEKVANSMDLAFIRCVSAIFYLVIYILLLLKWFFFYCDKNLKLQRNLIFVKKKNNNNNQDIIKEYFCHFNFLQLRGFPPYPHFGTWKKSCYMKFLLVGLYCGPLLTLIPPLNVHKPKTVVG